jgi:hypothetical protein
MDAQPMTTPDQIAPLMVRPVEQKWTVSPGMGAEKVAVLTLQSPWSTMVMPLTEEAALQLADALRKNFSSLEIATELPHSNGKTS